MQFFFPYQVVKSSSGQAFLKQHVALGLVDDGGLECAQCKARWPGKCDCGDDPEAYNKKQDDFLTARMQSDQGWFWRERLKHTPENRHKMMQFFYDRKGYEEWASQCLTRLFK